MKKIFVILIILKSVSGIFAQPPQVAVSPVKMNVLYIGIDNPLVIAVSGVPAEKVSAVISQGTLEKVSESEYIAKPRTPGTATVEVFAEIDGQQQNMGSMEFRVKILNVPVPTIAGRTSGVIEKKTLMGAEGVVIDIKDFLFDMRYTVTQFDVETEHFRMRSNSASFTNEQKMLINRAEVGEKVYISNIKARIADGSVKDFPDMVFTIE